MSVLGVSNVMESLRILRRDKHNPILMMRRTWCSSVVKRENLNHIPYHIPHSSHCALKNYEYPSYYSLLSSNVTKYLTRRSNTGTSTLDFSCEILKVFTRLLFSHHKSEFTRITKKKASHIRISNNPPQTHRYCNSREKGYSETTEIYLLGS